MCERVFHRTDQVSCAADRSVCARTAHFSSTMRDSNTHHTHIPRFLVSHTSHCFCSNSTDSLTTLYRAGLHQSNVPTIPKLAGSLARWLQLKRTAPNRSHKPNRALRSNMKHFGSEYDNEYDTVLVISESLAVPSPSPPPSVPLQRVGLLRCLSTYRPTACDRDWPQCAPAACNDGRPAVTATTRGGCGLQADTCTCHRTFC